MRFTTARGLAAAPSSPDLEAIAAEHPDLIVGVNGSGTADLSQLEAIAPVADLSLTTSGETMTGIQAQPWYAELELLAKILNRQSQADAFVARYEAAAAAARPELAAKTVSILSVHAGAASFSDLGPTYYVGPVLSFLGLTVPGLPDIGAAVPNISTADDESVSIEQAGALRAEYLIIDTVVSANNSTFNNFITNPVVAQVPAVQAGRAIYDGFPSSIYGWPFEGCVALLDDIPLVVRAFETTGQPIYRALGPVGASGSLSSVNYNGYSGPLFSQSGGAYAHISNPGVQLAPGTTVYGI